MSAEYFMGLALEEAKQALREGNIPVGAVIVANNEVIGAGRNYIDSTKDDTKHAELVAIQSAIEKLNACTGEVSIYTTLEPCMMCMGAIVNVGIQKVYVASKDKLLGATEFLSGEGYYGNKGILVRYGILREESHAVLSEYVEKNNSRWHLVADCS